MTPMEIYLIGLGSVALLISGYAVGAVIELRQSHIKTSRQLAEAGKGVCESLEQNQQQIRSLYEIANRQAEIIVDMQTRVMGLMKRAEELANLRSESRQAAEILLEKIREHERKLDALAVAILKKAEDGK